MKQKIEDLFNLVSNLDINEETKNYFLEKIWNEDFSEEFFDELEKFLENDIEKKSWEISKLNEKIFKEEKKISNEQKKNFEVKKILLDKHRVWLKEIYQEANRWISEIEREIDEKIEGVSGEVESDEIEKIKKKLSSD